MIDGEGTIVFLPRGKTYGWVPCIRIANTNVDLLKQCQAICQGGSICLKARGNRKTPKGNKKPVFVFIFTASIIREILPKVLRYLIAKRRQAELLLEALELLKEHRARNTKHTRRLREIYLEIKRLNRKGRRGVVADGVG